MSFRCRYCGLPGIADIQDHYDTLHNLKDIRVRNDFLRETLQKALKVGNDQVVKIITEAIGASDTPLATFPEPIPVNVDIFSRFTDGCVMYYGYDDRHEMSVQIVTQREITPGELMHLGVTFFQVLPNKNDNQESQ